MPAILVSYERLVANHESFRTVSFINRLHILIYENGHSPTTKGVTAQNARKQHETIDVRPGREGSYVNAESFI